jgi:hypothetical protein
MDEVVVFVLSVVIAVSLIMAVGQYVIPTIVHAAEQEAEYAALRAVSPILILGDDNKTVYICVNSTLPASVFMWSAGGWLQADHDCYIHGGACTPNVIGRGNGMGRGNGIGEGHLRRANGGVFCVWYLGAYRVGDRVAFMLKGQYAAVVKNYTVAAIRPLS